LERRSQFEQAIGYNSETCNRYQFIFTDHVTPSEFN
jgi:hypothetical protein